MVKNIDKYRNNGMKTYSGSGITRDKTCIRERGHNEEDNSTNNGVSLIQAGCKIGSDS